MARRGKWSLQQRRWERDNFLYSDSTGKNFVYQTDVTFLQNSGAASLVFRSNNDATNFKGYVVNLDGNSHKVKFMRWGEANLIDEKEIATSPDNKYALKVVALNGKISYYVNGILVANLGDYILQRDDKGQTTYISDGHFGLLNWNGEMVFQNTFYRELTDEELPIIDDVTVTSKMVLLNLKVNSSLKKQLIFNTCQTIPRLLI